MKNNHDYMTHREPADMHGDGVHFNEQLLAKKREKELQLKKLKEKENKKQNKTEN
ncbi:MAG: hypothetical protein WA775_00745 [Psychroserpens sp.]|uniref:hypothetical protein n=1 Tax=Psychroserpens sp. TaxID=2020870 RepID=UPI003C76060C